MNDLVEILTRDLQPNTLLSLAGTARGGTLGAQFRLEADGDWLQRQLVQLHDWFAAAIGPYTHEASEQARSRAYAVLRDLRHAFEVAGVLRMMSSSAAVIASDGSGAEAERVVEASWNLLSRWLCEAADAAEALHDLTSRS